MNEVETFFPMPGFRAATISLRRGHGDSVMKSKSGCPPALGMVTARFLLYKSASDQ
jgi:hypothetical protein